MSRQCLLTGKRPLLGHNVSHSNIKTRMRQLPNLQWKRLWVPEFNRHLRVRVTTRALRGIAKLGFVKYCASRGISVVAMPAGSEID
jgi:large subunit ribosomal protein L28